MIVEADFTTIERSMAKEGKNPGSPIYGDSSSTRWKSILVEIRPRNQKSVF